MKISKTTMAGTAAAAFLAAAQAPGNPAWLTQGLTILAAVAVAVLGKHAKDCPPNCPGTTEDGRPKPWQGKLPFGRGWLCIPIALASLALAGCAMTSQTVTDEAGRQTRSHVLALWPATTALDSATAKQTRTAQTIGLAGVREESGGTNVVQALAELRGLVNAVMGAAK